METLNSGFDPIEDCKRLIREAQDYMYSAYPYVTVGPSSFTPILLNIDIGTVCLWACSLAPREIIVDVRLPGVRRTLEELAESGAPWSDFQAVRYKFWDIGTVPAAEQAPAESVPLEYTPVEQVPVEQAPVDHMFLEPAPVELAPVEPATIEPCPPAANNGFLGWLPNYPYLA